ncbi:hypothetical protein BKA65DRAFT_416261, partial [Rhexocercosporidium sp. MPI-PUGE-AT-0058]
DTFNIAYFNLEQWLINFKNKSKEFSVAAGPLLTFGIGPRGCYKRRLAYIELRIFLTLIMWTFELEKYPLNLNGYASVNKLTHVL